MQSLYDKITKKLDLVEEMEIFPRPCKFNNLGLFLVQFEITWVLPTMRWMLVCRVLNKYWFVT